MFESEITPTLTRLVLNRDVPFMHVNLIAIERDYKNKQTKTVLRNGLSLRVHFSHSLRVICVGVII